MMDKGYDHPLYSLDLCASCLGPGAAARLSIPVPEGRLAVRRELLGRARRLRTDAVDDAVARALPHHRLALPVFARHGLSARWAESLAHWTREMMACEEERTRARITLREIAREQRVLIVRGQRLLGRLGLSAHIAGLSGVMTRGRAPRAGRLLGEALERAAARVREGGHGARLAQHGFGSAELEGLQEVAAGLMAGRAARARAADARAAMSDRLLVLRAAVLGDLLLLCRVAKEVLPETLAAPLGEGRLLPRRAAAHGLPARTMPAAPSQTHSG